MWVGCIGLSQVSVKKHRSQLFVSNSATRAGKASTLATDLVFIIMQQGMILGCEGKAEIIAKIKEALWIQTEASF